MPFQGQVLSRRRAHSALPGAGRSSEKSRAECPIPSEEALSGFRRLLAPFVPSVLHDSEGALDISKIPAKNFSEFHQFLTDHAAINDDMPAPIGE